MPKKPYLFYLPLIAFFLLLSINLLNANTLEKTEGIRGDLSIQQSHNNEVISLDHANHHDFFITGGKDSTIKVWQKDGQIIRTINIGFWPNYIQLFDNDRYIFAASTIGDTKIISVEGDKYLYPPVSVKRIQAIAISPNNLFYAIAAGPGKVLAYKMDGEKILEVSLPPIKPTKRKTFNNAAASIGKLVFSQNSAAISASNFYGEIISWDLSGKLRMHEKISEAPIKAISMNKNNLMALGLGLPLPFKESPTMAESLIFDFSKNKTVKFKTPPLQDLFFSPKGDKLYALTQAQTNKKILIYDLAGKLLNSFVIGSGRYGPRYIDISSDNKYFVVTDGKINPNNINIWSTKGKLLKSIKKPLDSINDITISPNGEIIASALTSNKVRLWSINGKYLRSLSTGSPAETITYTPDGKKLIVATDKNIQVWDAVNGKKLQTLKGQKHGVYALQVHQSGDWFAAGGKGKKIQIFNTVNGKFKFKNEFSTGKKNVFSLDVFSDQIAFGTIWLGTQLRNNQGVPVWEKTGPRKNPKAKIGGYSTNCGLRFSHSGKWIAALNSDTTLVYDKSGKLLANLPVGAHHNICDVLFMKDDQWLAITAGKFIEIWDWRNKERIAQYAGHLNSVNSLAHIPKSTLLISGSSDGQLRLWNLNTAYSAAVILEDGQWVIYDNQGFFDASKEGGDIINFSKGNKTYSADQFALYFNRPDIIFSKLGLAGQEYYLHLTEQYKRRITKAFMKEKFLSPDISVPEITLINKKETNENLKLTFTVNDNTSKLKAYQIYNNNVPLFGKTGKPLKKNHAKIQEEIALLSGENHIEMTAFNEKGGESLRISTKANLTMKKKSDLYFVGLGVSKYKNNTLNLKYAAKDVYDLSNVFIEKYKGKKKVHVKLFIDEQVTKKALTEAKQFLSGASIHDTVILFISGHGGYERDQLAEYYYLTYDSNPKQLTKKAISWSNLEDLLYSIKPNKKLLLMDTCESGEMDIANQIKAFKVAKANGFYTRAREILGDFNNTKRERRNFLYYKDRYIYNDLIRGSGAIVFSSSAGGEMSFESDKLKNGFFTSALIAGLSSESAVADNNHDGRISIGELVQFTRFRVGQQTQGLQNPTVDRGNSRQPLYFRVSVDKLNNPK